MKAEKEICHEFRMIDCEITGFYDVPQLPRIDADPTGLNIVPFTQARKEKNPRKSICHFFLDEETQEKFWNFPEKYFAILKNFKFVISPDFSIFSDMPKAVAVYNMWRNRTLAWYMWQNHIDIIPSVESGGYDTFDFCFEGLPEYSTLAMNTNGMRGQEEWLGIALEEVEKRLHPKRVIIVGQMINDLPDVNAEIVWLDGYSQQLNKKLGEKNGK